MKKKQLAERDAIVTKYLPRIRNVVKSFVKRTPKASYLQADMEAEATYWVLYAATKHVSGRPIKKMDGYMHQCIMTGIHLAVRGDKGIQKPRTCVARKVVDFGAGGGGRFAIETLEASETPLLDVCCRDDIDVDILKLRFRGGSHQLIRGTLNINSGELQRRLTSMRLRLEALESGEGDVAVREDGA